MELLDGLLDLALVALVHGSEREVQVDTGVIGYQRQPVTLLY